MARPTKPTTEPVLLDKSSDRLTIQWAAQTATPAVTGYDIRWRPDGGSWSTITGIPATTLSRTFWPLDPAQEYDFQFRAVNGDGNGNWSAGAMLTTDTEDEMTTILQSSLTRVQAAIATTEGQHLASTMRFPYISGAFTPTVKRKTLDERAGLLADTTDVVTMRGSELQLTQELDCETILFPLLCALNGGTTAAASNSVQQWAFTPGVTAPTDLKTASFEIAETDGGSANFRRQFEMARPTEISIEASTETSQMSTTWIGRAAQPLNAPATPSAPARTIIPAAGWTVSINDTWAALGNTDFGEVRSLSLNIDPGLEVAPTLAGRADLDFQYWYRGRIRGGLNLVVDHNTDTTDELTHWQNGDLRYIRLEYRRGNGASLRGLTIDLVGRYIESPDVLNMDGEQHTLDLTAELRADAAGRILAVTALNSLTST